MAELGAQRIQRCELLWSDALLRKLPTDNSSERKLRFEPIDCAARGRRGIVDLMRNAGR